MYDVVIIGAGVTGAAAAMELSRYNLSVCVVEKEEDVCAGTSKANSALVHAGFDAVPGSLKARLNRRGSDLIEELCGRLDVPFVRNGALVAAFGDREEEKLEMLLKQGAENGVPGLEIIRGDRIRELEPALSGEVTAALYAPSAGIVCPFELTLAMAENAYVNGVEFRFDTRVKTIRREAEGFLIGTDQEDIESRLVINAAGVYADELHNMICDKKYRITARRGEYCLLDKTAGLLVRRTIFQVPGPMGKGILVTPTVHGNLLLGPTAEDTQDKEAVRTTGRGLEEVLKTCRRTVPGLPVRQVITSFAGLRAHEEEGEFVIGESDAPGFIDALGIESPGLSASPAVGEMLGRIVRDKLKPHKKNHYIAARKGILRPETLSPEERKKLILDQPAYGHIICRCETVTEGEILDAVNRPLGARSLDGIKRRTRAGMGRCQSGFCSPKVMELLSEAREMDRTRVTKSGGRSLMLAGRSREAVRDGL